MLSLAPQCLIILAVACGAASDEEFSTLLDRARMAVRDREPERAVELAGKAIDVAPDDPAATNCGPISKLCSANIRKRLQTTMQPSSSRRARPSCTIAVAANASSSDRSMDRSRISTNSSVLRPDQEPAHWKRGISYYYAGRFDEGRKQFEGYQTVDDNDVENAVWRYSVHGASGWTGQGAGRNVARQA